MEAFLDVRVEAALDAVPVGGATTGEQRVGTAEPRTLVVSAHRLAPTELVVVLEDVTELRRLQQIRTEFIDNLGHELRTPLSTVTLLAETLAREAELAAVPTRMRERIALIEVETGHIAQMVNEMLDLARMEGGSRLHLRDDVDLARLAAASAERLRPFAERSGVTLVTERSRTCPPCVATRPASARSWSTSSTTRSSSARTAGRSGSRSGARGRHRALGHGPWHRHQARRSGADLRAVLQGGPGTRAGRRHGARPRDRPPRRGGPRRADHGRVRGGRRLNLHRDHPHRRAGCAPATPPAPA